MISRSPPQSRILPSPCLVTIRRKLIVSSLLAVGLPLVLFAFGSGALLWQFYLRQLGQELDSKAHVITAAVAPVLSPKTPDDPVTLAHIVDLWRRYSEMRVTIVDEKGQVQAATRREDVGTRVDEETRPGMRLALAGQANSTVWRSPQYGNQDLLYENLPVFEDGQIIGAVRVSYTLTQVRQSISRIRMALAVGLGAYGTLIVGLTLWLANSIARPVEELNRSALVLAGGDLSHRVRVKGTVEVVRLGETLNRLTERLQQLEGLRRRYVSNASHELRTPLASIRGLAETLMEHGEADPALRRQYLPRIIAQTERLARLASQMLDLAQGETDDLVVARESVNLYEVLCEATQTVEATARERDVHLWVMPSSTPPTVCGDRDRLFQLSLNLVENAVRHTGSGGSVTTSVEAAELGVRLLVSDTGCGISPDDLPHVFERFYRAGSGRSHETGGTGLGLSIVRQIAEAHGGHVRLESELGTGTRAICELPSAPQPVSTSQRA